jgi:hypothetical protein
VLRYFASPGVARSQRAMRDEGRKARISPKVGLPAAVLTHLFKCVSTRNRASLGSAGPMMWRETRQMIAPPEASVAAVTSGGNSRHSNVYKLCCLELFDRKSHWKNSWEPRLCIAPVLPV